MFDMLCDAAEEGKAENRILRGKGWAETNTPGPPSPLNIAVAYFHSVPTACFPSFCLKATTEETPLLLSPENKVAVSQWA